MTGLETPWPLRRFPVLVDDGRPVMEATVIITPETRDARGVADARALLDEAYRCSS